MRNQMELSMEMWGALLCAVFIFFIITSDDHRTSRVRWLVLLILNSSLLLLSDITAVIYRGNETTLGYYAVRVSNYLCFAGVCVMIYICGRYLNALLQMEGHKPARSVKYLIEGPSLLMLAYVTLSQFTGFMYTFDEHNRYQRGYGTVPFAVFSVLLLVFIIVLIAANLRKMQWIRGVPMLIAFSLVIVADIIQWLFYGTSLAYTAIAIGMTILFLAFEREKARQYTEHRTLVLENELKIAQQEKALAEKESEMAKMESQLTEKRTQLMLSQIQPHFLYNTLAAISCLCTIDPEQARKTTEDFSTYLRSNLNSLSSESMVPFERELKAVKAYLAIEQTRFGDDLEVEYDIRCMDFMVPTLSLQPIVENAVRHGVCMKEYGGKVTIRTEKVEDAIHIDIIDTGVGYDPDRPMSGRGTHVGLKNVTERLKLVCNGTLEIHGVKDVGTTVRISLPC